MFLLCVGGLGVDGEKEFQRYGFWDMDIIKGEMEKMGQTLFRNAEGEQQKGGRIKEG